MLSSGTPMYLLIPNASNKRVLHEGKVIESDANAFVSEFDEAISPEVGTDVNAFAEVRGKFFQQGAQIIEMRSTGPRPIIAIKRVGEVVSAEQRQTYRVSVVTANIAARVGREVGCRVVDVSPEGCSFVAKGRYELGSLVEVSFAYEAEVLAMTARVQTARTRADGSCRYGFLAPPGRNTPARKALQNISASVQRLQLRRLAGAA